MRVTRLTTTLTIGLSTLLLCAFLGACGGDTKKESSTADEFLKKEQSALKQRQADNAAATEKASIPELIRKHHKRMVHFHANDPNRQGPGFGDLDFVPILAALRSVAFQGWISVEVFDYKPGPERLAHESIAYLKKCLRE